MGMYEVFFEVLIFTSLTEISVFNLLESVATA